MGLLDSLFFDDVLDHSIHNAPLYEVELSDGGHEALEFDARRTTEGVEELLRVSIETRLIGHVHREHLAIGRRVRDVLILCVVGDEPFKLAKRDAVAMLDNVMQLLLVI